MTLVPQGLTLTGASEVHPNAPKADFPDFRNFISDPKHLYFGAIYYRCVIADVSSNISTSEERRFVQILRN